MASAALLGKDVLCICLLIMKMHHLGRFVLGRSVPVATGQHSRYQGVKIPFREMILRHVDCRPYEGSADGLRARRAEQAVQIGCQTITTATQQMAAAACGRFGQAVAGFQGRSMGVGK